MRRITSLLFIILGSVTYYGQTFNVQTIINSGDNNNRINLVFMGDGYTSTQQDKFITDVTKVTDYMFTQSPFKEYANYFNVYAIEVISNESGADHPGIGNPTTETTAGVPVQFVDTFFNSTFDAYGNHYLLYYELDENNANDTETKIYNLLAENFPAYDFGFILVNTEYYGGSGGGPFPMASVNPTYGNQIAIHELSHSLFDLKDEYYPGDLRVREVANMTQESDPSLIKWKNWIGINNVNIFQHGTSGEAANWYKPTNGTCIMQAINKKHCSVCIEGAIEKIHDYVSPIDSYSPISNTVDNPNFPLEFGLNLVKPIPNSLVSIWKLNNTNFATNTDNIALSDTDLIEGTNTLTAIVTDNSSLLKVDNHVITHIYTVTWTINYSTLSIDTIISATNNLTISTYPNPTNDIINFEFENNNNSNLKIEIIGLNGKIVKSVTLSNYETQQVDISELSTGIYITNYYADNTLVASKKIVKN